jgi:peptide/nickel transport system permease protein
MSSVASIEPGGPALAHRSPSLPLWLRNTRLGVILAGLIIAFFLLAVIAPSLLATNDPYHVNLANVLRPPSIHHLLGTDESGRDLYSRIIYGARESLLIGLGATGLAMVIAVILGVASGLSGGFIDGAINRAIEVLFSFPVMLLALLVVAIFGPSVTTEIVAVGVGTAPGYARMIRGQVIAVKDSGYVEAARALGHPYGRVVRRHIFPNAMRPLVVLMTLGVGQAIVWASGLAFVGLGVAPPSPEWGALLDAGRNLVTHAWWLEVMPGLAIVLFALSMTTLGRNIQQRLEGVLAR